MNQSSPLRPLRPLRFALLALSGSLGACAAFQRAPQQPLPLPADLTAPDSFDVEMLTTKGTLVVRSWRHWSPRGADRFYTLVRVGFFDSVAFHRTINRFVAQFGIHGDTAVTRAWDGKTFADDTVRARNERGTLSFARGGPNTRNTQLFFNTVDNTPRLDTLNGFGFPPIGKVIRGLDVLDSLNWEYSGTRGGATFPGPSQDSIRRQGNAYLVRRFPRLDYILRARVVRFSPPMAPTPARLDVDVLVRGGTLVDGTGAPGRRADVGITGDRITFVGDAGPARVTAKRTIDAAGLVVAPGFVDPHTHAAGDLSSPERKGNVNYLMQGVTTVVTNNDGGGPVDVAAQRAQWTRGGIGTNAAVYVGHGSIRRAVMGMSDAAPTPAQLDSMKALVARAMDAGAIGLSTGLYYAPGSYATTEEIIELARVAAAKGGRYDSHIRDESSYTIGLIASVREVIRIGREARLPVHISHIKALGVDVWGRSDSVIALMRAARAEGVDVTASQYPYTASGTGVGASLLPRWAEVGGRDSLMARIADAATRARLEAEMTENMRRRGGANSLLITGGRDSTVRGQRLDEVAAMWGTTPIDAALRIIRNGDASVASFNMDERDIVAFMQPDFISTGSDGSGGHPRLYGTYPKLFREYVREKRVLPLERAVERSAWRAARQMGLRDRGLIAPGYHADVIVFDPATIADRATYVEPTLLSVGVRDVLVNGVPAVENGRPTGALAGRVLR